MSSLPTFDTAGAGVSGRWKRWVRAYKYYVEGRGITDNGRKRALLLSLGGMGLQDLYESFGELPAPASGSNAYKQMLDMFDDHFSPVVNTPYERTVFRNTIFNQGETIPEYVARLKMLAGGCDFGDSTEDAIRDQVMSAVCQPHLQRKFLEEGNDLTLAKLLTIARNEKAIEDQVRQWGVRHENSTRQSEEVAALQRQLDGGSTGQRSTGQRSTGQRTTGQRASGQRATGSVSCYRCLRVGHKANSQDCPAISQRCRKCNKEGHFAGSRFCELTKQEGGRVAKRGQTAAVQEEPVMEASGNLFAIQRKSNQGKVDVNACSKPTNSQANATVCVHGIEMNVLIDSGSSVNLIDSEAVRKLCIRDQELIVRPTNACLFPYGSKAKLGLIGECTLSVQVGKRTCRETFYVFDGSANTIIGVDTAVRLGLLTLNIPLCANVNEREVVKCLTLGEVVGKYPTAFDGIGKFTGDPVKLNIDQDVEPVAQPVRRLPFGHREGVESMLDDLLEQDIIERVEDDPSGWVSPIVTVPKEKGGIRMCVDLRLVNQAIKRTRHPIPTAEEMIYRLNGSKVLSKVDMKSGFFQLVLDPKSRDVTTMVTEFGLFRYKRLVMGLSSASEIYQYTIQKAFSGLKGVQNFADDIVIWGSSAEEHNERLEAFMNV